MPGIVNSKPPVLCPDCEEPMVLRNSARGQFYGCQNFPRCRGTRKVGEETKALPKTKSDYAPIVEMPGTAEQEAIWDFLLNQSAHVVINAGPGVGKTWSMVQYCLRAPRTTNILFAAFNKHIAKEADGKMRASRLGNVFVKTSHSWGNGIVRAQFPKLSAPDENKMTAILEQMVPMPLSGRAEWRRKLNLTEKLCSYVKNYLIDYQAADFADVAERTLDHHGVDLNGNLAFAIEHAPRALDACKDRAAVSIDFDDMLWLPVMLNLPVKYPAEVALIDESQDLNALQHELVMRMVGDRGRVVIVGDRRQAINQFRGAMVGSMDAMRDRLATTKRGVKEFPMTITQRCPKLHVQMARSLFPDIQALDNAPMGSVESLTEDKALAEMRPGDLVVCRCNAPLVTAAYALIRRNVRPVIKGRDFGKNLLQFIDLLSDAASVIPLDKKCSVCIDGHVENGYKDCLACCGTGRVPDEMGRMSEALKIYKYEHQQKLLPLGDKAQGRLTALDDKCDCMAEFIHESKTVAEMRGRIESLFQDDDERNAVVLGTVHRTKGLESHRVFILAPELIPHPAARKPWERECEKNIAWIACTRAKFDKAKNEEGTIIFCGRVPAIYGKREQYPAPEPVELEHEVGVLTAKQRAENACSTGDFRLGRALDKQQTKHDPLDEEDDEPPF